MTANSILNTLRHHLNSFVEYLRRDIQSDIKEWEDRGIILSSLLAAADAWFIIATAFRYIIHIAVVNLYLEADHDLTSIADQLRVWNAHPIVVDRIPRTVEANARTLTSLFGIWLFMAFGFPPSFGSSAAMERFYMSSQVAFLVLDPVWGLGHYLYAGRQPYEGPFRPLTDAQPDK